MCWNIVILHIIMLHSYIGLKSLIFFFKKLTNNFKLHFFIFICIIVENSRNKKKLSRKKQGKACEKNSMIK